MEAAVNAWISDNNHDFLNVTNSTHEFLEIVIHGKPVQLIVPDAFYAQSAKNNSEEVFMAVRDDDESDTEFDSSLYLLNEKLERVKVGPNCLNTVLDCIATSFRTYRKRPKISLNEEIDKRAVKNGYLFKLSKEAKAICEETRAKGSLDYLSYSGKPKSAEEILFWCDVSADPDSCTVILEIDLIGIIDFFHLAEALGFCFGNPLKINLLFEKKLWQRDDISSDILSSEARVKASCQGDGFEFQGCEAQSVKIRSLYGPEVLVPELVKLFFRNGEGNDVTRLTWEDFGNQFVQLLIFVGMHLSMLPRWCLICKRQLPFCPSRLCTCNSPTCLYQFQNLGLGTTVLQDIQNSSEVVDLRISLALAASEVIMDAFEPLQAFFPENAEIYDKPRSYRDYSGTIEQGGSGMLQSKHELQSGLGYLIHKQDNMNVLTRKEKLKCLQNVLKTFPPVAEMQRFADESELRLKLGESWLQALRRDQCDSKQQLLDKDFVKSTSLPYDVLGFILCTSRLKLHLLKGDSMLHIPDSLYQFAIVYSSSSEDNTFHNCHDPNSSSLFAFHGSSVQNIYSALRNGLRHFGCSSCVSGRTSNAEGINVSSQLSAALVHSTKSNIEWENGTLKEGFLIAAIFEVSFKSGNSVDSTSMMVSVEHEDTALRYLIILKDPYRYNNIHIVDGHSLSGNIDLHSHYKHVREEYKRMEFGRCMIYKQHRKDIFDKRIEKTNPGDCAETFSASVSTSLGAFALELESASNLKTTSSMKTIMKEYHNLSKVLEHGQTNSTGLVGVRLKLPDENNICRWHVSLSQDLFRDHPLYKDLLEYARQKNLGQACILLELTFPPDYPFAPPFVRIVRPRFKRCTGHITVGGSICMELLTRSGWSPACSVESLLVQVQNAIIEGGGRLDKTFFLSDDEYNEGEAHEAFDRVALDHRWV